MPNIVVLVKQVPDTYSERKLTDGDHTLDRDSADAVLDEINERAIEEALQIKEAHDGEVTVLTVGPDRATDAIRKALSMGADKAVHVVDDALHGSDVLQTAKVLAAAIGTVDDVDLVIAGNEASDGTGGAVPAMLAELLGYPQLTHAREVTVDGTTHQGRPGDRRGPDPPRGEPARGDQRRREDQRAAVPVLQGHHGRQEEAGRDARHRRPRHRRGRGRPGQRLVHGRRGGAQAAARGRPAGRGRGRRRRRRSPSTWSARS